MNPNFYGNENSNCLALNNEYKGIRRPVDLYYALSNIWCEFTCTPRLRKYWTEDNKTLGQCSITAFLFQDIFGGRVYGIARPDGSYHCYNVVGNSIFDLTSEQFGDEKLDYSNNLEQFRGTHFSDKNKLERYEFLREKLKEYLKSEKIDISKKRNKSKILFFLSCIIVIFHLFTLLSIDQYINNYQKATEETTSLKVGNETYNVSPGQGVTVTSPSGAIYNVRFVNGKPVALEMSQYQQIIFGNETSKDNSPKEQPKHQEKKEPITDNNKSKKSESNEIITKTSIINSFSKKEKHEKPIPFFPKSQDPVTRSNYPIFYGLEIKCKKDDEEKDDDDI